MDKVRVKTLTGEDHFLTEHTVQTLQARLRGPLLRAGDAEYDNARQLWNGMIDKKPAFIARCTGVADVIDAVNFAREHNLLLSIRGGGHNIAGLAVCDGGLMIDLSMMKGTRLDPATRQVWVQPGATLGDLDRETQAFGLVVPAGIVSTTGVAGLTLGGGFGWLTRKYGFTCDNLRSVDLVTADGCFLRASTEQNADLFWGVCGGGGNFGIVTTFEFEAQPLGPTVMAGLILYPMEQAADVLHFYREFTRSAPEELTCLLILRLAPPAPFLPPEIHGKPVAGIAVCYAGSVEDGERVVRPLKAFGSPVADVIKPKPFAQHQTLLDAAQPHGRCYYWKSEYLPAFSEEASAVVLEHCRHFTSPHSAFLTMHLGGAASRIAAGKAAAGHRDAAYIINIAASWENRAESEQHIQWARDFHAAMRPFSTGGVYVNFLTEEEGPERTRAAYEAATYDRLIVLKNQYDPMNLFRLNKNIMPTEQKSSDSLHVA